MKKKLIKNLSTLNRNISINFYSNYMIYNYLNNYALKFYFYFLLKKKYYLKNKKKILFYNKSSSYSNCTSLAKELFFFNANKAQSNFKNKFFNNNTKLNPLSFLNNKFLLNKDKIGKSNNSVILTNTFNYVSLHNKDYLILYKELFYIIFIISLIKLIENYKTLVNLIYFLQIKI